MPKSIEPADRRPLVYGVFVLLILVAASYLFWPRTPEPESLVLTPESVRTGSAAADMSGEPAGDEASPVEDVALDESAPIREETRISDEPPTVAATPTPERTSSTPDRSEPARTVAMADNGPSGSGNWVLNVGAYSTEAAARSRAEEISRQGMSAHVHRIVSNGKSLWRVRVGYFATKAKAGEYADWMRSTHGIEGWASER